MERLTYKNYIEEYEVNFEKSSDKNWSIAESDTYIKVTGEPIDKLGKLEDVLEEFELTSAEDLRNHLNFQDNMAIWEGKLELKNKIADLEQELAELKQKAIVPKFKVGQEVWVNDWTGQLRIGRIYEVQTNAALHDQRPLITYLVDFYGNYEDDDRENDYYEEKEVFATKEEAEQKLAEIRGEDE